MSLAILIPIVIYLISFIIDIDDGDFVKGMHNDGYTPKEIADETGLDMSEVMRLLSED